MLWGGVAPPLGLGGVEGVISPCHIFPVKGLHTIQMYETILTWQ